MKGSHLPGQEGAAAGAASWARPKIARATALLAAADVDLRGRDRLDRVAVLEMLVARLAALSAVARAVGSSRTGRAVSRPEPGATRARTRHSPAAWPGCMIAAPAWAVPGVGSAQPAEAPCRSR